MCLLIWGCEKYLDIKSQSTQVFIETSQDCQRLLDNYNLMNLDNPCDGEISADDYYMTSSSYLSRNPEQQSIYTWQANAIRSSSGTQWRPSYLKIYNANLVLEALEKLKDKPDQNTRDALKGAALFFRAFSFWQVAQLYAKPYSVGSANTDPGIPIRETSDINEISSRGSVKNTYDKIIGDLKIAAELLPITSPVSSRPNKVAAYAMLARVYLSMEDYSNAFNNANLALNLKSDLIDYNSINQNSSTPFTRFNNEVIFQALMTSSSGLLNGSTSGLNVAKIDSSLVASYDLNDLRRNIFFKKVSNTTNSYAFTGNYEPSTNGTYFVGLAVDELYLIRSECFVRANNLVSALSDLNVLLAKRWNNNNGTTPYQNIVSNNADEILRRILVERRKELIMRGQRWTELRRLNKDNRFAITLIRKIQGLTYSLPPNDLRYTLLIPTEVILNSNITQNNR